MARASLQPGGAVVGRLRDDLAEQHHAASHVVFLERGVGVAAKLRHRLAGLAGVGLDLGFELDRGVVELGALEGFVGGGGRGRNGTQGNRRKGDERGNEADADMREHGMISSSPLWREFPRGRPSKHNPESCPSRDRETADFCRQQWPAPGGRLAIQPVIPQVGHACGTSLVQARPSGVALQSQSRAIRRTISAKRKKSPERGPSLSRCAAPGATSLAGCP